MPMMNLTYPAGTFTPSERDELAEKLTTALLRAERAPDTEFFRNITWVYAHEMSEGAVLAAGRPVEKPILRLEVTTPQGALSERRRAEMVSAATEILREAAGIPAEEALTRVWVLMHEIPEGQWGAGGEIIYFERLKELAKAERDQQEAAEPVAG
jgi:phenylpyruvate tautomerase PptA (4-oxalocrotonate tautomerase family)